MNNSITKENLLFTFPVALRDSASIAALGNVTAEALALRPAEISRLSIYPQIDKLPEDLLDILAYDFKVDWWNPDYGPEEKRRTLKENWKVHKMLGTKAAVETALSAIYPTTTIEEWFEYGGQPYHFRARTTNPAIASGGQTDYRRAMDIVKRLSAWMDAYIYQISLPPFRHSPGRFRARRLSMRGAFYNRRAAAPVYLDGKARLDGSFLLNQATGGVRLSRVQISAALPRRSEHVRGRLIADNWRLLDGSFALNGTYLLDAYLRTEEL